MAEKKPLIQLEDISKVYKVYNRQFDRIKETLLSSGKQYHRPFHALSEISFTIRPGETVGIIGQNGSGKSTLLQVICKILQPTRGTLVVDGRISALLELGAGFNPEFTGRENVYLNAAILGLEKREIDACFDTIVQFAGIGEFIDRPVKTYSSGMYVRLAFAVAINVDPDILVVDEALSVGDTLFQAKCFAKFREFQEKGVTILFVTHSMDLITRYCSKAFLLDKGRLVAAGEPKTVVDRYNRLLVDLSVSGNEDEGGDKVKNGESQEQLVAEHMQASEARFALNPDESRYGNGKAEIVSVGIYSVEGKAQQSLIRGEKYEIRMRVRFHSEVKEPIYAFTVKDVRGFDISGTNTLYHETKTGTCEAGQEVEVRFVQDIHLNPGGYLLSFGCAGFEDGDYIVYERRYDLISFDMITKRSGVGIFDMDTVITVEPLTAPTT